MVPVCSAKWTTSLLNSFEYDFRLRMMPPHFSKYYLREVSGLLGQYQSTYTFRPSATISQAMCQAIMHTTNGKIGT